MRYVVTEYGVADLWGKSVRERAMELIEIAHPRFRDELLAAAKERRYVFPDQVVPRAVYPLAETRKAPLRDGRTVVLRPLRVTDEEELQSFFYSLSDESIRRRFLAFKKTHPHEEIQKLVDVDFEQSAALVAYEPDGCDVVGMCR